MELSAQIGILLGFLLVGVYDLFKWIKRKLAIKKEVGNVIEHKQINACDIIELNKKINFKSLTK